MSTESNSLRDRVAQIIGSIPPRLIGKMTDDEVLVLKCAITITLGDHANEAATQMANRAIAAVRKHTGADVPTEKSIPAAPRST